MKGKIMKQKGFALIPLVVAIATTVLLSGVLYIWVTNTMQSGGLGKEAAPAAISQTKSNKVPNIPLDVYIYAEQSSPTTIPANTINVSQDVNIESLAVWGVPAEDDFALGIALALTSDSEASAVYDEITLEDYGWKRLSGDIIYLVQGSGPAAESLKTAITNNDFKNYDDISTLQAVEMLPSGDTTRLAGVAIAKPSKTLVDLITEAVGTQGSDLISIGLELINLQVVVGGLYSPNQIDVAEVAAVIGRGGTVHDLDLGVLVIAKSGLPGLVVRPAAESLLGQFEFEEARLGELALYKRSWDINEKEAVQILVRVEGNYIFAAISGQESYAETLITSVQVE